MSVGSQSGFQSGCCDEPRVLFSFVSVGKTITSVALHLDDRGYLKHLFYRDAESSFGQKVTCFEEDSEDDKEDLCEKKGVHNTMDFWNKIWSCRNIWGVPARA